MVSVLFVRKDSIYKALGADCWDMERDARMWTGGNSIVCHPPCRAWGKLKAFAKPRPDEKQLAIWSIEQIRKWGGVLEHPRHSGLWKEMGLPTGNQVDEFGGYSISVDQYWWGHKAQKETLLYICGVSKDDLPVIPLRFDRIDYCVRYGKKEWKLRKERGIKSTQEITKPEREATPIELAKWLLEVAGKCDKKLKIAI